MAHCRAVLTDEPDHPEALRVLGLALAQQGRAADGLALLERALERAPREPALHAAHGRILLMAGRTQDALASLERALALDARQADAQHCLAVAWHQLGRLAQAEAAARAALQLQPDSPDALDNLGAILMQTGRSEAAESCFTRALALAPAHPGALGDLALLYEQCNRLAEAERLATEALAAQPDNSTLWLVRGRCLRRRGEYAAARAVLQKLENRGTPALAKDVAYELGLCADAEGEAAAAFAYFERANRLARQLRPQALAEGRDFLALIENLRERFTPEWLAGWTALPPAAESLSPVFILGFPRSGTTLLDTMLGAHPSLAVLEEKPTLQAVLDTLAALPGGYPDSLAGLDAAGRERLRQVYWHAVGGETGARQWVDKSPFYSVHAGCLQRLFPEARLLFVSRHPCDVVLSCFLTNFALNAGTVHFTSLDSTVELYCQSMALWQSYRERLPLRCLTVRYEELLERPEAVLREVLEFIGVPWSPAVLDHAAHAVARGRIESASYAQVSRPLYQEARGRWQRYRRQLEPYLGRLAPFVRALGYAI